MRHCKGGINEAISLEKEGTYGMLSHRSQLWGKNTCTRPICAQLYCAAHRRGIRILNKFGMY